jgi:hypothetical protein
VVAEPTSTPWPERAPGARAPRPDPGPAPGGTWGLGDVLGGLAVAQIAPVLIGAAVLVALGYTEPGDIDELPLTVIAVLQIPLWLGYLGAPLWATTRKGHGLAADFGWRFEKRDVWFGLVVGVATQLVAVPLLYVPIFLIFGEQDVSEVARELTDRATDPLGVALLVLVVVVGAPIIEELFFRGLFHRAIVKRGGPPWLAVAVTAVVFGGIHFQLVQLPALVLFGVVAGWLTVRSGRLGPAVWAHVGFNAITVVALLATS